MARQPYSDEELERIKDMRKRGDTWEAIGEAVGRNPKALYSKFHAMKHRKNYAKYQKKTKVILRKAGAKTASVTVEQAAPTARPMIALVGTPHEVTTTIRELFS